MVYRACMGVVNKRVTRSCRGWSYELPVTTCALRLFEPAALPRLRQHFVHDLRGEADVGRGVERLAQLLRLQRGGHALVLHQRLFKADAVLDAVHRSLVDQLM